MVDRSLKLKSISGVYSITNLSNGKRYVGSSINIRYRCKRHKKLLTECKHTNCKLQRAWDKYGVEDFIFEMLEHVPNKHNLLQVEQYWMDKFSVVAKGYNIALIAKSVLGTKRTKESREKLSKALMGNTNSLGHKQTREFCEKISGRMMGNKHGEGVVFSEERRRKISEAHKGIKSHMWGTKRSTETREKSSISLQKYHYHQLTLQGELVKVFKRRKELVAAGFDSSCVSKVSKGKRKQHKNFSWLLVLKPKIKEG